MHSIKEWQQYLSEKYFNGINSSTTVWGENFPEKRDKIVVHIPARSGSKRLCEKNIVSLCGIPLMAYTILVAKALPVDRVIVSTDSPKFAAIAEKYGAEVPYLRPEELSEDMVPAGAPQAFLQMHLMSQGYPVSSIIDLYPTSPFRNIGTMASYCEIVRDTGHCCTVTSPNCSLTNIHGTNSKLWEDMEVLKHSGRLMKPIAQFIGSKVSLFEIFFKCYKMISNPIELIDIDRVDDLLLAQKVIENELYDFGVKIC